MIDNKTEQTLSYWENKINNWADPKEFSKLYPDFQKACDALSAQLHINTVTPAKDVSEKIELAKRLSGLINKTISTLLTSQAYENHTASQVVNFSALLGQYMIVMRECMENIHQDLYKAWSHEKDNQKREMINYLDILYRRKTGNVEDKQLKPSGTINITAEKIGRSGFPSIIKHANQITLYDLFQLADENINTSIAISQTAKQPTPVPAALEPVLAAFKTDNQFQLLYQNNNANGVHLEYIIPKNETNSRVQFKYNEESNSVDVHISLVSKYEHLLKDFAENRSVYSRLFNIEEIEPARKENTNELTLNWRFNQNKLDMMPTFIMDVVKSYVVRLKSDFIGREKDEFAWSIFRYDAANIWLHSLSVSEREKIVAELNKEDEEIKADFLIHTPIEQLNTLFPAGNKIDVSEQAIAKQALFINFEKLDWLIQHFGFKFNVNDNSDEYHSIFESLMSMRNENVLLYLKKYAPDLSQQRKVFQSALYSSPELAREVIKCKAPFVIELQYAIQYYHDDKTRDVIKEEFDKSSKEEVTQWLYHELNALPPIPHFGWSGDLYEFLEDKIDFNYKPEGSEYSLIELILLKFPTVPDDYVLSRGIDLSKQPNLVQTALQYYKNELGEALMEKGAPGPRHINLDLFIAGTTSPSYFRKQLDNLIQEMDPLEATEELSRLHFFNSFLNLKTDFDAYKQFYLDLLTKHSDKIDFNFRPKYGETIFEQLVERYPEKDVKKFLDFNIDFSKQDHAISHAAQGKKMSLILTFLDKRISTLSVSTDDLNYVPNELLPDAMRYMSKLTHEQLSTWFKANGENCNSSVKQGLTKLLADKQYEGRKKSWFQFQDIFASPVKEDASLVERKEDPSLLEKRSAEYCSSKP